MCVCYIVCSPGCFYAVRHCDFGSVDVDGGIVGSLIRRFADPDHLVAAALTVSVAAMADAMRWRPELVPCVLRAAADSDEHRSLPIAYSEAPSRTSSGSWLTVNPLVTLFSRRLGVNGLRVLEGTWDMVTGDR